MNLRRARVWEWLAGTFGAALVVSLFLDWYGCTASRSATTPASGDCRPGAAVSAWSALAVSDVVMLIAGLLGLLALVLTLLHRTAAVPLALTSVGTIVAFVAAVLAVLRLVVAPDIAGVTGEDPARLLGAWLGALSALGLLASLLGSMRDERIPADGGRGAEGDVPEPRLLTLSSGQRGGAPAGPPPRLRGDA